MNDGNRWSGVRMDLTNSRRNSRRTLKVGDDALINGRLSWWRYGGAGDATPSETGPIKQHTRQ